MVPPVRGVLGFCGGFALKLEEGCLDVLFHVYAHMYVDVVSLEW